jgi:hypothetical protein
MGIGLVYDFIAFALAATFAGSGSRPKKTSLESYDSKEARFNP